MAFLWKVYAPEPDQASLCRRMIRVVGPAPAASGRSQLSSVDRPWSPAPPARGAGGGLTGCSAAIPGPSGGRRPFERDGMTRRRPARRQPRRRRRCSTRSPRSRYTHLVVLWAGPVPLGHVELDADVPRQLLVERLADAIAPAVGERLFPRRPRASSAPPRHGPLSARGRLGHGRRTGSRDAPVAPLPRGDSRHERRRPRRICRWSCAPATAPEQLERCLRALDVPEPPRRGRSSSWTTPPMGPAGCATRPGAFPASATSGRGGRGLSAARNAGIRAATSAVIAFTDDDTVPDVGWAARILEPFSDRRGDGRHRIGASRSSSTRRPRSPSRGRWAASITGIGACHFDGRFLDEGFWWGSAVWHVGAGANMAFRRESFATLGLFDERLGAGRLGLQRGLRDVVPRPRGRRGDAATTRRRWSTTSTGATDRGLEVQIEAYMRGHLSALFVQFARHRRPGELRRALHLASGLPRESESASRPLVGLRRPRGPTSVGTSVAWTSSRDCATGRHRRPAHEDFAVTLTGLGESPSSTGATRSRTSSTTSVSTSSASVPVCPAGGCSATWKRCREPESMR